MLSDRPLHAEKTNHSCEIARVKRDASTNLKKQGIYKLYLLVFQFTI